MLKLAQLHCCCTLLSFTTFKIKIEDGNACCYKKKIIVVYASTDMSRSTCLFYCLFSQLTHISCADYVRVYRAWQSPCILCVKTTKALISSEKTLHPHCYTALYYTCVPIFLHWRWNRFPQSITNEMTGDVKRIPWYYLFINIQVFRTKQRLVLPVRFWIYW